MEDYYQYGQKLVSGVEVPCTKAEQSAAHSVCKAVVTTEDTFTASHTVITVSNKYWATDKSPVNGFKGTAITSAECTGANDRFWLIPMEELLALPSLLEISATTGLPLIKS